MDAPRAALRSPWPLLIAAALASGCAHAPVGPAAPGPRPESAFLPLEDLSGRAGAGVRASEVMFTALVASGRCRLVEPGEVEAAMDEARIRTSGVLTRDQTRALAERLRVRWLLTGTVLDYGPVHTPDGETPSVGIVLRLIDGPTGEVAWADQRHHTGDDRESLFGWGRENQLDRLAQRTATELATALRFPERADSSSTGGGGR